MVPKDWRVGAIKDLADTVMGFAFKSSDFVSEGISLIRMGNLYQNTLDLQRNPIYLPPSFRDEYSRFLVKPGDLVMSMTGTMGKRDYGFTVHIPNTAPISLLNQRVLKLVPKKGTSPGFLLYLMRSEYILSRLFSSPGGTKQANLSTKQIQELPALIPPIAEQKKIANIFSAWDKAIGTTEQLLTNSQQQKKALMQQLLTSKKRFLGFSGEWSFLYLKELCDIRRGASPRPINDAKWFSSEGRGWIRIADVTAQRGKTLLSTSQYLSKLGATKSVSVEPGDLIMSICGTIGVPKFIGIKACIHDGFVTFRNFSDSMSLNFLYQYLVFISDRLSLGGQPGTQKNLNTTIVGNILFPRISHIEQEKIATVLSTADQEIENLQKQFEHLKQEKKALMQQLLTGKRRVKI